MRGTKYGTWYRTQCLLWYIMTQLEQAVRSMEVIAAYYRTNTTNIHKFAFSLNILKIKFIYIKFIIKINNIYGHKSYKMK